MRRNPRDHQQRDILSPGSMKNPSVHKYSIVYSTIKQHMPRHGDAFLAPPGGGRAGADEMLSHSMG